MMEYTCKQCGRQFEDKPSRKRIYCSKTCHDEAQSQKVEVQCYVCKKKIAVPPSKLKFEKHFCGNECRQTWLAEERSKELNVKGHSKGHKAPHLTRLNRERNPKLAVEPDAVIRGTYESKKHRRTMERIIGRKLKAYEDVHHINGIRNDNRPENLQIMNHSDHLKLHWQMAKERGVI